MAEVKYLDQNGLSSVWGKVKGIVTPKADKVTGATNGNLAGLDANGNIKDSGLSADNVALKDGSYSGMSVGTAEDLESTESVATEFTERITGGSVNVGAGGSAFLERIKGRTVVWNQLVKNPNFINDTYDQWTKSTLVEASFQDRILTISPTSGAIFLSQPCAIIETHKYFIRFRASFVGNNVPASCFVFGGNTTQIVANTKLDGVMKECKYIITSLYNNSVFGFSVFPPGDSLSIDCNYGVTIQDLTLMFGAGNEPSTAEEFEALYPGPYYDYNPGTLVSNAATAIETEGWNQYDPATGKARVIGGKQYHVGGTYTSLSKDGATITPDASGLFTPDTSGEVTVAGGNSTDTIISLSDPSRNGTYEPYWRSQLDLNIQTLTGKLNGSGNSVVIFPGGLRSAGTVHDEIVGSKAIKRIGAVDLGSLTWTRQSYGSRYRFFSNNLSASPTNTENVICNRYIQNRYVTDGASLAIDKSVSIAYDRVYIIDDSYTDADAFKTDMQGVMLYYELATPEEYVLDEAIPTAMRNDPYGTERRLPADTPSTVIAPFAADIIYATNIKEAVRQLPQNYISVGAMQDFLAALGTQMGGTWSMRPNDNGKFTFTFTPNQNNG